MTKSLQIEDLELINPHGQLIPLNRIPTSPEKNDVAAIIVDDGDPEFRSLLIPQLDKLKSKLKLEVFVIDPTPALYEPTSGASVPGSRGYSKSDGLCFAYNMGIRWAKSKRDFKFYWLTSTRVFMADGGLEELIRLANADPEIAILFPRQIGDVLGADAPPSSAKIRFVISGNSDSFLIRSDSIASAGFLNPGFKFGMEAMVELSYQLHSKGWKVAACDNVEARCLDDPWKRSGQKRDLQKAKEFAARYFVEHYGKKWDEEFSKTLPAEIEGRSYGWYRREWEQALNNDERRSYATPQESALNLRGQIDALNPWYYPVKIGTIHVFPGKGSKQSSEQLCTRIHYRSKLLVDEVRKRYDFANKKLLDIASNCGYWSARYAELGARSLLAVEGRIEYVRQGWLYWGRNLFMKKGNYDFIHGNIMDADIREKIRGGSPYDFTLCAGILYHIPHYEELVKFIASVSREAILIDTRVSGSDEHDEYIEEPGGWCFDAIIETRFKQIPRLPILYDLLDALGFKVEALSTTEPIPIGLHGNDDYSKGKRMTLLALRKSVANTK